ncbi:MAG TPA: ABC transporter permease [Chitinophagaceae bacterium]|nr:ABC transporter permease [Chitinophagaceae bacterium]
MIKHYFKIAFRNLAKQKVLTGINILGLSIGLACFILFLLYAVNEFTFDRFHKNADNVFRMYRWTEAMGGEKAAADISMPMPLGPALKQDIPDVKEYVRFRQAWGDNFVKADGKISSIGICFADPQFFKVFSFEIISGIQNPLNDQRSIVLNEKTSKQLFGRADPVGKTVEIKLGEKFEPFTVSAVVKDPPANSTIQFDILGSFVFYESSEDGRWVAGSWQRSAFQTYVQLQPASKLPTQPNVLVAFRKKYYPDELAKYKEEGHWKSDAPPVKYGLQPLAQMHTNVNILADGVVDPKTIWILISIAAGVLLIACINFTTLAIGRSATRAKEVGIRKVVGSRKKDIIFQFLSEAFLLTLISSIIGILLVQFLLPYFNQLAGRELVFSFAQYPQLTWLLVILIFIVGLIAGGYPSLVLAGFKPIEVLKSKMRLGGSNFFTKSLVTVQFTLSVALIISTLVIAKQLKFMRSANPGFNKENMIVVDAEGTDGKKLYPLFKQAALKQPTVAGVAASEMGLGEGQGWSSAGFNYNGKSKNVYEYYIDNDYLKVMGMQLIAGRNFDTHIASDTINSVIVNEAMVKDMGWTVENAVGQKETGYSEKLTPVVIGVVKDFHFRPFSEAVAPQQFHQFPSYSPHKFFVRIKQGDPSEALATLSATWKSIVPDLPFKYSFLDDNLNKFYKSEVRWSNIVGWAAGISIFLACLGLLGLASLAAVNRIKEIGIRKVLGASVAGIVALLSKDFLRLVVLAFIIATPLAWYFMNKWLQDFAYRINISWWIFMSAGAAALLIALITVSFQAIKAAIANPVKSLRTE